MMFYIRCQGFSLEKKIKEAFQAKKVYLKKKGYREEDSIFTFSDTNINVVIFYNINIDWLSILIRHKCVCI